MCDERIGKMKMQVDIDKSKTILINSHLNEGKRRKISYNDEQMEIVITYKYLESMTTDGKMEAKLSNRMNKETK